MRCDVKNRKPIVVATLPLKLIPAFGKHKSGRPAARFSPTGISLFSDVSFSLFIINLRSDEKGEGNHFYSFLNSSEALILPPNGTGSYS